MDDEEKGIADNFQNEVPITHVNIKPDLHTGNAKKKVELLLKLFTVDDYGNGKEQRPLSERDKVGINKNSFNNTMAEFSPAAGLTVESTLNGNGNEQDIALEFRSLKDFRPEQVTKNAPQLRVLLAMHNLLRDLKSNLLDSTTFRHKLESILKDPTLSSGLRNELAKIVLQENV